MGVASCRIMPISQACWSASLPNVSWRNAKLSPHTIASYRDTFRLLLEFAQKRSHKAPSTMALTDLDPPLIGAFLDELEKHRGNSARSRNLRLTAIRSFFHYAAFEEPAQSALIQRVLAMPSKRYEKKLVGFLTRPEIDALLAAPIQSCGRVAGTTLSCWLRFRPACAFRR